MFTSTTDMCPSCIQTRWSDYTWCYHMQVNLFSVAYAKVLLLLHTDFNQSDFPLLRKFSARPLEKPQFHSRWYWLHMENCIRHKWYSNQCQSSSCYRMAATIICYILICTVPKIAPSQRTNVWMNFQWNEILRMAFIKSHTRTHTTPKSTIFWWS